MTGVEALEPEKRRLWPFLAAAVLVGVALAVFAFSLLRPHAFAGGVIQDPPLAPGMEALILTDGSPVDLGAWRGDVTMVYFGYTHCPDLCPTTLATVARAKEMVGSDGDRVHMLMVTVDPARDSPELLHDYVTHFDPDFEAAWGEEDEVRDVAGRYGVQFILDEPDDNGDYEVGHTSTLYAIDAEGYPRVVYGVGVTAEDLAADMRELLG